MSAFNPFISRTRTLFAITGAGVVLFLAVVLFLHVSQPGYDPLPQFVSELALGRFGGFLWLAFFGLSLAIAANLRAPRSSPLLPALLVFAAACFLAAGIITLAVSVQIHVWLIAAAFVSCGLGMYLLPCTVAAFSGRDGYLASWACALVMCLAVGLGGNLILSGVAQRVSALALLFWLSFVAWRLAR